MVNFQTPQKEFISKASLSGTDSPQSQMLSTLGNRKCYQEIMSQKDLTKLFLKEDELKKVLPLVLGIAKCQQWLFFSLIGNWKSQLGKWGWGLGGGEQVEVVCDRKLFFFGIYWAGLNM